MKLLGNIIMFITEKKHVLDKPNYQKIRKTRLNSSQSNRRRQQFYVIGKCHGLEFNLAQVPLTLTI